MGKKDLAIDLLAFAATVLCAILLKWETGDIAWGLWACSLWVGYAYILVGIIASVYPPKGKTPRGSEGAGLSLLAFFTFHFGLFHFGHSAGLNKFFPLIEVESGIPNLFVTAAVTLKSYWPLILATFISRYSDFPFDGIPLEQKTVVSSKPYKNVARMHLLILVFVGLHALRMSNLAIYPVLLLYFVPWARLRQLYRNRSTKEGGPGKADGDSA